jgi:hypothetical protein
MDGCGLIPAKTLHRHCSHQQCAWFISWYGRKGTVTRWSRLIDFRREGALWHQLNAAGRSRSVLSQVDPWLDLGKGREISSSGIWSSFSEDRRSQGLEVCLVFPTTPSCLELELECLELLYSSTSAGGALSVFAGRTPFKFDCNSVCGRANLTSTYPDNTPDGCSPHTLGGQLHVFSLPRVAGRTRQAEASVRDSILPQRNDSSQQGRPLRLPPGLASPWGSNRLMRRHRGAWYIRTMCASP